MYSQEADMTSQAVGDALVTLIAFMTGPFPISRDEDMILASEILKKVGAPQTFYIYKCLCDYFDGLTDAE